MWRPGWRSYLQSQSAEILQAIQGLFYYCFTSSSSCFYLSLTHRDSLSIALSSLCLPLTSSLCLSSVPVTRSLVSSSAGRWAEGGSGLDALPSHVDCDTAIIYHTAPQTQQLMHRHTPQQQMGIPGLDGPARPFLGDGRDDQKLRPVLRGWVIKL